MIKKIIYLIVLLISVAVYSQNSFALSCRYGSNASSSTPTGSISQEFPIGSVSLAVSDFTEGTLLWRSSTYTATFTCWDANNRPQGEDAYIYWNPQGDLSKVDKSLSVGVTINGVDYDNINTSSGIKGPDLGPATKYNGTSKATPLTVSVTFSIYIKATGVTPPSSFTDIGSARVFQVDGVLGLNSTPNSNYNALLTNFNNITVLQCTPSVTIVGTSSNTVDFGTIMKETSSVGKIAKMVPFTVTADVSGGGCKGQQLVASFSSGNVSSNDSTLLIPSSKPGVGIYITPSDSTTPITFGNIYSFSDSVLSSNTSSISKTYNAYLKWLTNSPTVGAFTSTAVISITFK